MISRRLITRIALATNRIVKSINQLINRRKIFELESGLPIEVIRAKNLVRFEMSMSNVSSKGSILLTSLAKEVI